MKKILRVPVRFALRVLLRILFRVQVGGGETIQWRGRQLIVANHVSFLDGLVMGLFLPVDPVFVVIPG